MSEETELVAGERYALPCRLSLVGVLWIKSYVGSFQVQGTCVFKYMVDWVLSGRSFFRVTSSRED